MLTLLLACALSLCHCSLLNLDDHSRRNVGCLYEGSAVGCMTFVCGGLAFVMLPFVWSRRCAEMFIHVVATVRLLTSSIALLAMLSTEDRLARVVLCMHIGFKCFQCVDVLLSLWV